MSNTHPSSTAENRDQSSGLDPYSVQKINEFWHERATGSTRKILIGGTLAFAEFGYHGATTRAIAVRAGMSPASVYIHFDSKEELFHRIALEGHQLSTGSFINASRLGSDPASKLRIGIASFAAFNAEHCTLARTVEYEIRMHRDAHFADIWKMRGSINTELKDILTAGIEQGQFQIADTEWMKVLLLSACIDISRWYRHGTSTTPEAIGFQYADLAMSLVKGNPGA